MSSFSAKRFRALAVALLVFPGWAYSLETLTYRAELNSVLTLGAWATVGTVTVTSRDVGLCPGGGSCRLTEAWLTSEAAPALEALYPLRYLYRTAYRPVQGTTLAFEELRNRRNPDGSGEYGWRHRLLWLQGRRESAMRYDFEYEGDETPEDVALWIHSDKAGGQPLKVHNTREVPMGLPALDRLGGLDLLRRIELTPGVSLTSPGAGPKGPLTFVVTVEQSETVETAPGHVRDAWRVRIEERRSGRDEPDPAPLYAWIADDAARTPVRFSMDHVIGRLRLTLEQAGPL